MFERRSKAGGALNHTLSPLRIEKSLVAEEVQRIADMGVRFVFNSQITDTDALLTHQGFDSIFVSPGLQGSRLVRFNQKHEHWQKDGVISALSFLESTNSLDPKVAREMSQGKSVVVIGGGSVAMDCAITAKALGAQQVHIVSREALLSLPADEDEIRLINEIGGIFHPEAEVVEVSETNKVHIRGFGAANTGFEATLTADTVIVAAGQVLDETGKQLFQASLQNGSSITKKQGKRVVLGGDAASDKGETVVQAVADGKRAAIELLPNVTVPERPRGSLQTKFCDIVFENPFCLSSSPVTNSAEMIARSYDAGFGGAYYKTLNREDKFSIAHPSPRLGVVKDPSVNGALFGIQNLEQISDRPLADNLKDIAWLRKNYPTKITAVSIMGYCDEDWEYLAQVAEGAGAHMLELNFSCPQMARKDAGHHVGQQLDLIERYTAAAKRKVRIPVIAKLTPNITDMVPAALAAQQGGADAISAINTVKSISHVDLKTLTPMPTVQQHSSVSGYSGRACRPIGLRFVSDLARDHRVRIPISGMGGIYTWKDAVEYLAVGSSNLQVTTAVMQHGVRVVEDMIDGLQRYLAQNQKSSNNQVRTVEDLVGIANKALVDPAQLDSTKYEVVSVIDKDLCIGCGACVISCRDGAAQAIHMAPHRKKLVATVDRQSCVGCKMCEFVCPVGAVSFETRPRIERPRFSK